MLNQERLKLKAAAKPFHVMFEKNQTLRDSLPLSFTSFVNKCGAVGLNLLPMMIVEKGLTAKEGSIVLGIVKASTLLGTFFGGYSSDNFGLRTTILISFGLTTIGLGLLPLLNPIVLFTLLAALAQTGHAMFPSAARLMLLEIHGHQRLQEGIAWLRTANNAGSIVGFSLSAGLSYLGIAFFFFIDAGTSLLAFLFGWHLLPGSANKKISTELQKFSVMKILKSYREPQSRLFLFFVSSLIIALFSLNYEMAMIGIAAKAKLLYADDGLKLFSWFMIINTIICAVSAIPAARFFKNIKFVFIIGFLLAPFGGMISLLNVPTPVHIFIGALFMTMGEVIFTSMAQYCLLILTPESSRKGALFSFALILQKLSMILAGFITLPLVVYGNYAHFAFGTVSLLALVLVSVFLKNLTHADLRIKFGLKPLI